MMKIKPNDTKECPECGSKIYSHFINSVPPMIKWSCSCGFLRFEEGEAENEALQ